MNRRVVIKVILSVFTAAVIIGTLIAAVTTARRDKSDTAAIPEASLGESMT
ncbi:MAG: hypothetical protein PHW77_00675 [Eubacteriales bacterium]|nr:hypothetical protein [Eubacteriales bacterium]